MNDARWRPGRLWLMMVCLVVGLLLPMPSRAEIHCQPRGMVFGYFNGVRTTEEDAWATLLEYISPHYGPISPEDEPITYELFYNDTDGFSDFVETFEQRLQEHDALLAGRFELFFSSLRGEGAWWTVLINALPDLGRLLDALLDASRAALVHTLSAPLGTSGGAEVSARHRAQIDGWVAREKKLLFFAHSQGNLFASEALQYAGTRVDPALVRLVQVAPASTLLQGHHTLADKDVVIQALRLSGATAPVTDVLPGYLGRPPGLNGERDWLGHGLLEIYLNPALSTAARVDRGVLLALLALSEVSYPYSVPPPFPDFVSIPFAGGEKPGSVWEPDEASHQIERIEMGRSVPWRYIKEAHGDWRHVGGARLDQAIEGWSITRYLGKGVNGLERCAWGTWPMDGWAEPFPQRECTFERIPTGPFLDVLILPLGLPDELREYRDAPVGTEVSFNQRTFTYFPSRIYWPGDNVPSVVKFWSGETPRWSGGIENRTEWAEPYELKRGRVLNLPAIEAWNAQHLAYSQSESARRRAYDIERAAYERQRYCRQGE